MHSLDFVKISATGNDFILIDNRALIVDAERDSGFFRKLCQRRQSVGADGVILLQKSSRADFEYVHINSDGSIAEMCGNGSRAVAYFAKTLALGSASLNFEIGGQIYRARIDKRTVTTEFLPPRCIDLDLDIVQHAGLDGGGFVNTGVPHYVIYANAVSDLDVNALGRVYRHHARFPQGANIDFVEYMDKQHLRVRTFERGVERETLACGTGAVAAAVISYKLDKVIPPVRLSFPGGELSVDFNALEAVELCGNVYPVFRASLIEQE